MKTNVLIIILSCILFSCIDLIHEDGSHRDYFTFAVTDSQFRNLVGNTPAALFHPDILRILNSDGSKVSYAYFFKHNNTDTTNLGSAGSGWIYTFIYVQGRYIKNINKVDQTFYLHLSGKDVDTIRVNGLGRDYFEVFYNGKNTNGPDYYPQRKPGYADLYFIKKIM